MAKAQVVDVDPEAPFADAARLTLRARAGEVLEHREGATRGDDIEQLHDFRVATRRLRAVLEFYAGSYSPRRHRRFVQQVKRAADATSAPRDLDVQIAFVEHYAKAAAVADQAGLNDLVRRLRAERLAADAAMHEALAAVDPARIEEGLRSLIGDDGNGDESGDGDGSGDGTGDGANEAAR